MIFAREPENQIFVLYSVSYLIIGRYKEERDVPPPPQFNLFIFMQFLAKIIPNKGLFTHNEIQPDI